MARPGEPLTPSAWHAMERAADRLKRPALMKGRTKSRPVVSRFTVVAENTNTVTCAWPATSSEIAIAKRYGTRGSITGGYQPGAELYAAIHIIGGTGVPQTEWQEIGAGEFTGDPTDPNARFINIEYRQLAGDWADDPAYNGRRGCRFAAIDRSVEPRINERGLYNDNTQGWPPGFPGAAASYDDPVLVGAQYNAEFMLDIAPVWHVGAIGNYTDASSFDPFTPNANLIIPWVKIATVPQEAGETSNVIFNPAIQSDTETDVLGETRIAAGFDPFCECLTWLGTGGSLTGPFQNVPNTNQFKWLIRAERLLSVIELDAPLVSGIYDFTWRISSSFNFWFNGNDPVGQIEIIIRNGSHAGTGIQRGYEQIHVDFGNARNVTKRIPIF